MADLDPILDRGVNSPDPVLSRLRERPLPDAPAWFAAATLARLRREGRVVAPGLGGAFAEFVHRLIAVVWGPFEPILRRWLPAGGVVLFLALGWHLKQKQESRQLTNAALDAIAQGEVSPFQEEETPAWSDVSY